MTQEAITEFKNIHDDWYDVCEKNPLLGGKFISLYCLNNKLLCILTSYFLLSTTAATRFHKTALMLQSRLLVLSGHILLDGS